MAISCLVLVFFILFFFQCDSALHIGVFLTSQHYSVQQLDSVRKVLAFRLSWLPCSVKKLPGRHGTDLKISTRPYADFVLCIYTIQSKDRQSNF